MDGSTTTERRCLPAMFSLGTTFPGTGGWAPSAGVSPSFLFLGKPAEQLTGVGAGPGRGGLRGSLCDCVGPRKGEHDSTGGTRSAEHNGEVAHTEERPGGKDSTSFTKKPALKNTFPLLAASATHAELSNFHTQLGDHHGPDTGR